MKSKGAKRRKRAWYTAKEALNLAGTVEIEEEVGSAGRFSPLTVLVRWIPAHRIHRGGRDKAHLVKVLLVMSGLGVAGAALTIPGSVIGGCLIASSLVLPVPSYRKSLWISRIESFGGGRVRTRTWPAEVHWNGRKVSVRVNGRVARSLRPFEVGLPPIVALQDEEALLGLLPRVAGEGAAIWVQAPGPLPKGATLQGSLEDLVIENVVRLPAAEWELLWETMTDSRQIESLGSR